MTGVQTCALPILTAPGFDPFAALAVNGVVEADTERMVSDMDADAFQMFVDILPSLGHTGEGHCHEY